MGGIIRSACRPTAERATTSNAAIPRWRSAMRRHRAARHNASSIHTSRARECPRVIGGIAASTKAYFVNHIGRRIIIMMLLIAALAASLAGPLTQPGREREMVGHKPKPSDSSNVSTRPRGIVHVGDAIFPILIFRDARGFHAQ
jgi:hypothetical protein